MMSVSSQRSSDLNPARMWRWIYSTAVNYSQKMILKHADKPQSKRGTSLGTSVKLMLYFLSKIVIFYGLTYMYHDFALHKQWLVEQLKHTHALFED